MDHDRFSHPWSFHHHVSPQQPPPLFSFSTSFRSKSSIHFTHSLTTSLVATVSIRTKKSSDVHDLRIKIVSNHWVRRPSGDGNLVIQTVEITKSCWYAVLRNRTRVHTRTQCESRPFQTLFRAAAWPNEAKMMKSKSRRSQYRQRGADERSAAALINTEGRPPGTPILI